MSDVIFVEDDDALRTATVQALELAGFGVRAFADARTALAAITPDFAGAIVSDIRMPGMDGLELLAAVREADADLSVILVTGHGDVALAVSATNGLMPGSTLTWSASRPKPAALVLMSR